MLNSDSCAFIRPSAQCLFFAAVQCFHTICIYSYSLDLLWFSTTTVEEIHIKGFAGGGILIDCKFHSLYSQKCFSGRNSIVCTTEDSRVLRHESVLWGYVTFIMLNLTSSDNGTYYCVEDGGVHTKVHLHVVDGKTSHNVVVS